MADRSDGCSSKIMLAPCAMEAKDYYWIGSEDTIGMFSKSCNDLNSFICKSLSERQLKAMFNKLSYSCGDWKLFCELASIP